MVTPDCAETLPICTVTGAWPAVSPAGIRALIWVRPGICPGTAPQYCTGALTPPMVTVALRTQLAVEAYGTPSTPAGVVGPAPVRKSSTKSLALAGCAALL